MSKGEGPCALGSGRDGAGAGGAFWGKIVAIVPPRGNMPAGVAADAPGDVHLGKTGLQLLRGLTSPVPRLSWGLPVPGELLMSAEEDKSGCRIVRRERRVVPS